MAWRSALSKNLQELRWVLGTRLGKKRSVWLLLAPFLTPCGATSSGCRIHLCQTSKGSEGARCGRKVSLSFSLSAAPRLRPDAATVCRDFVLSSYQELKKANPTFPILVRECSGVEAKLVARYGALAAACRDRTRAFVSGRRMRWHRASCSAARECTVWLIPLLARCSTRALQTLVWKRQ